MAEIVAALIGGIVTFIVAIIAKRTTIDSWIKQEKLLLIQQRKEIDFRISQRQQEIKIQQLKREIEEFYAPLWGIVQRSRTLYEVALQILPSENGKVKHNDFSEEHYTIWRFFVEAYLQPLNSQIVELITTKNYLSKSPLPTSFREFTTYEAQGALYRLWKEKTISVKGTPLEYPSLFNKDVEERLLDLKKQYDQLLCQEIAVDAVNPKNCPDNCNLANLH